MTNLRGKTALITGSTGGIGLGIAHALAAEGCAIMLNGPGGAAEIERIKRDLFNRHEVKIAYSPADVTSPAEIRLMAAEAFDRLGPIDILVNNGGTPHTAPVEQFPEDQWDAIIAANLSAAFHASKAVLPRMRNRGWGRILNIASVLGLVASEDRIADVAAQHGIIGLTKAIALEAASSGITCNAICPGWVQTPEIERQIEEGTPHNSHFFEDAQREWLKQKQPLASFTTVEQIGAMAVFLCSEAAATMTGAALSMDGGWLTR